MVSFIRNKDNRKLKIEEFDIMKSQYEQAAVTAACEHGETVAVALAMTCKKGSVQTISK